MYLKSYQWLIFQTNKLIFNIKILGIVVYNWRVQEVNETLPGDKFQNVRNINIYGGSRGLYAIIVHVFIL